MAKKVRPFVPRGNSPAVKREEAELAFSLRETQRDAADAGKNWRSPTSRNSFSMERLDRYSQRQQVE